MALAQKTGIDLPNETRGLVYGTDMGSSTLATNSFGQNFTVNMIQMVSGFSSLINGGYYYEPRVVKQVVTSDDQLVKNYSKTLVKQTITKETSDYIKRMFNQDFALNNIYIKGEVSNCKYHTSGHIYFTLKDRTGVISAIMFAGNRSGLNLR